MLDVLASGFDDIVSEVRVRVGLELSAIARQRNETRSLQGRLPDELWCVAWRDLPLEDRIAVTRVCHKWRALALACPRVWCRLDMCSSLHSENCACQNCPDPRSMSERLYLTHPTPLANLHLIDLVLPWSKSLPLALEVFDNARTSDGPVYEHLANSLQPHVGRIASIELRFVDHYLVQEFLGFFPALPALRTLTTTCFYACVHKDFPFAPQSFVERHIDMPALEFLSLDRSLTWPWAQTFALSLPSLRMVTCTVGGMEDLLALLHACPRLSHIQLQLHNGFDAASADHAQLVEARAALFRAREIVVRGVRHAIAAQVLSVFDAPTADKLFFFYSDRPSAAALQALPGHLTGTTFLACAIDRALDFIVLQFGGGDPRKIRSVAFPWTETVLGELWSDVPHDVPRALNVEGAVWRMLAAHVRPMPQVQFLTLVLDGGPGELSVHPPPGVFPALRRVSLEARAALTVSAQSVAALHHALREGCMEPIVIALKNVRFRGDQASRVTRAPALPVSSTSQYA